MAQSSLNQAMHLDWPESAIENLSTLVENTELGDVARSISLEVRTDTRSPPNILIVP